jgi:hypothetical protein
MVTRSPLAKRPGKARKRMADKPDPLGEFDVVDYEPDTEFVTIQIHRSILNSPRHAEALAKRCEEIITHGSKIT